MAVITLPLNVNQLSKEIRWLVRVGMFSQNECLVREKHISGIMCENPRRPRSLFPLPTPILMISDLCTLLQGTNNGNHASNIVHNIISPIFIPVYQYHLAPHSVQPVANLLQG